MCATAEQGKKKKKKVPNLKALEKWGDVVC